LKLIARILPPVALSAKLAGLRNASLSGLQMHFWKMKALAYLTGTRPGSGL
jgi:hypothetical protein